MIRYEPSGTIKTGQYLTNGINVNYSGNATEEFGSTGNASDLEVFGK
jgi:hypothetical protein